VGPGGCENPGPSCEVEEINSGGMEVDVEAVLLERLLEKYATLKE
jgi:hypothetical protein